MLTVSARALHEGAVPRGRQGRVLRKKRLTLSHFVSIHSWSRRVREAIVRHPRDMNETSLRHFETKVRHQGEALDPQF